jgi:hypothetical protein
VSYSVSCHGRRAGFPDAGQGMCCLGTILNGPDGCTCWRARYDREQCDPAAMRLLSAEARPVTRRRMCVDCAYRPRSPEKNGDETYQGDAQELQRLARDGRPFFCHVGMRRVQAWRHPSGVEVLGHPGEYDPPIVDGIPYRADGSPAELCAGWGACRRALASPYRTAATT